MKRFWVILISLTLIGGAGYFGWQAWDQNRTKTNNQPAQQQQTQNDPSEGGKYLVISEWAIRFPVPEQFRGTITYKAQGKSPPEGSAVFATSLLAGTSCDITADPERPNTWLSNGVYLVRSKEKYVNSDSGIDIVTYYNLGKSGDFWYSHNETNTLCSNTESKLEIENAFRDALINGFKKLEGVQI